MAKKRKGVKAFQQGRSFQIEGSYKFAIQIPDNAVGRSGSYCSNCGNEESYCHQVCRECGLPFIGPFGLPQLPAWGSLSLNKKKALVLEIFTNFKNRGRMEYEGVRFIPLTPAELAEVEKNGVEELFLGVHGVSPNNLKNILRA
ncbi:MAG: hypothetical protein KAS02_02975 [Candidatus Pacebacteria bacterium]|nr:hypothetical protein [Candidatus Paceibacterota bacterium]